MEISVIISFYKNIPALSLILKALSKQTIGNFEVIVSEDDQNDLTAEFIKSQKLLYSFPIHWLGQRQDNGFRKNEMLNKSLKKSKGEKIIFLDGDCIPDKRFLEAYQKHIKEGILCFGRRVMVDKKTTTHLYKHQNIEILNFLSLFFTKSKRLKYAIHLTGRTSIRSHGLWGCNLGILKKHLLAINGFDEDYITAGVGEDVDLEWRLKANSIQFKSIRFEAIVYHLYHPENYSNQSISIGLKQLAEKIKIGRSYCLNGVEKVK